MILLESHNTIVQSLLAEKFNKPSSLEETFVDYDGVRFKISTPERKTVLRLSMSIRCWDELVKCGVQQVLEREYGSYLLAQPEPEYSVSLEYDSEKVPPEGEARDALIKSASLLKRIALGAPFELAFKNAIALEKGETPANGTDLLQIHYRDEEAIFIQAMADRVTVVFSTVFREEADRIFGKVFLQEFVDARRQPSIQTAPQVLFSSKEPPLEIRAAANLRNSEDIGYVTFVTFPRHYSKPDVQFSTISHIQLFRSYLHYHIKCSKAYMRSRMRHRVAEFQKVLNRAKTEVATGERKTASGRTLVQR
ncbi:arp2/3 complex 34 kDa subunit [Auriculariales sp. MPI-PUGE-AT-0066]|nr:arp2/3 complex 34 kDa subunit [Auriculariales sp. MPI-PUGE-AT-0066]